MLYTSVYVFVLGEGDASGGLTTACQLTGAGAGRDAAAALARVNVAEGGTSGDVGVGVAVGGEWRTAGPEWKSALSASMTDWAAGSGWRRFADRLSR